MDVSPSNILERDNRCEFSTSSTRSAYRKEPVQCEERRVDSVSSPVLGVGGGQSALTSFRQPMKLLLTGEPGRSAVFRLPPM